MAAYVATDSASQGWVVSGWTSQAGWDFLTRIGWDLANAGCSTEVGALVTEYDNIV